MSKTYLKYFSFVDLIVYIILFFLSNIIGSIISVPLTRHYGAIAGTDNLIMASYIPIFIFLVILSLIYRRVRCILTQSPCRFVGSGRLSANAIVFGMMMMIAVSIVIDPLTSMFPDEMDKYVKMFTSSDMWVTIGVTVVAAPILEEIFFRGILLKDMSISWGPRSAIFISSIVFAVLHFNIIQIIPTFLMGLVLGYVYIHTRRGLTTAIFLHGINNLVSVTSLSWGFGTESIWHRFLPVGWISTLVYSVALLLILLLVVRILTIRGGSDILKKLNFNDKL